MLSSRAVPSSTVLALAGPWQPAGPLHSSQPLEAKHYQNIISMVLRNTLSKSSIIRMDFLPGAPG